MSGMNGTSIARHNQHLPKARQWRKARSGLAGPVLVEVVTMDSVPYKLQGLPYAKG